jgi:hypothetical protein
MRIVFDRHRTRLKSRATAADRRADTANLEAAVDDYFESETIFSDSPRIVPGDERSAAIEIARSWELPYLDEDGLVIDSESASRVGGEELVRIAAAPVRCSDGSIRIVLADATPERIAAVREHFSGAVEIGVVTPSTLASLLDAASGAVVPGDAAGEPVWGQTLDRVVGLFDDEAIRLQELRRKLQELGQEMTARERRTQELEVELQSVRVQRLRDQETIDRLRHELNDRNGRLERAASKIQELATIVHGGRGL